jgi:hypothetical protein
VTLSRFGIGIAISIDARFISATQVDVEAVAASTPGPVRRGADETQPIMIKARIKEFLDAGMSGWYMVLPIQSNRILAALSLIR